MHGKAIIFLWRKSLTWLELIRVQGKHIGIFYLYLLKDRYFFEPVATCKYFGLGRVTLWRTVSVSSITHKLKFRFIDRAILAMRKQSENSQPRAELGMATLLHQTIFMFICSVNVYWEPSVCLASAEDTETDTVKMLLVSWGTGRPLWEGSRCAREIHGGLQLHNYSKGVERPLTGLLASTLPPPKSSTQYLGVTVMRWLRRADPRGPIFKRWEEEEDPVG